MWNNINKKEEIPINYPLWFLVDVDGVQLHKPGVFNGTFLAVLGGNATYKYEDILAWENRWEASIGEPNPDKKYVLKIKYANSSEEYRIATYVSCGCGGRNKKKWKFVDVSPSRLISANISVLERQQIEY